MKAALAILLALSFGGKALSVELSECQQAHANYVDRSGVYRLSFKPIESDSAVADLEFKLEDPGQLISFNGYVMPSDEENGANAILFNNCPEGDLTGEDLRACTVWEGIAQALPTTAINRLPVGTATAASAIELLDLRKALGRYFDRAKIILSLPGDDSFAINGCST